MNHGDVLQSQFDGMKWHFTSCFDKTFPLLRRWKILSCNKCGKTVNCSRLKLLLHAGLITHLTCRHTRKRKPYAALQLKLALNRNVLWIFALVLHHTTTCFSENCPFPICVRSSPYHGTSDHDGQRKWKIVYFFIFEIQSTTSGRLANYIRAFCHFLFCSFPATNIIKENNRISFRKNTTIHSIPASLSISAQLCWCSIVDSKRFSLLALSPLRVFVVVVKLCFCGISSVIASIKAPLIMKVVSFISIFLFP